VIASGGEVVQETLHFDPSSGAITTLRSKEEAHDYRYFPEPDLVPIATTPAMLDAARAAIGELPAARAERLEREFALNADSAHLLAFRGELGDFFEAAIAAEPAAAAHAQQLANWITGQLVARIGEQDPADTRLTPAALTTLVVLVGARELTGGAAREVLEVLVESGGEPRAIIAERGLGSLTDDGALAAIVAQAIAADPDAAAEIRAGNAKAIGALIGPVMRETRGRADGGEVTRLIREQLGV
jgi:aspartyl-tRNA(Asn)/glutamyl-tRNA(Gln) amidotransferase subunit B